MKAIVQGRYGAPTDVLRLADVEPPTVAAGDVLVRGWGVLRRKRHRDAPVPPHRDQRPHEGRARLDQKRDRLTRP